MVEKEGFSDYVIERSNGTRLYWTKPDDTESQKIEKLFYPERYFIVDKLVTPEPEKILDTRIQNLGVAMKFILKKPFYKELIPKDETLQIVTADEQYLRVDAHHWDKDIIRPQQIALYIGHSKRFPTAVYHAALPEIVEYANRALEYLNVKPFPRYPR